MTDRAEILRAAYDQGDYAGAVTAYKALYEAGEASPAVHFVGALAMRYERNLYGARVALELGLAGGPEERLRLQLLMTVGVVAREIGDTAGAIDRLERFCREVPKAQDLARVALGSGYYNLALAYRQAKRLSDAIQTYQAAIGEFRRENMTGYLRKALQNLAWVRCMAQDWEGAEEALTEAEALCDSREARQQQTLGRTYAAYIAGYHSRAIDGARQLLGEAPPDVRAHAYWIMGQVALSERRLPEADSLANEALRAATESKDADSRCFADAADLITEVRKAQKEGVNGAQADEHHPLGDGPGPDSDQFSGGGKR